MEINLQVVYEVRGLGDFNRVKKMKKTLCIFNFRKKEEPERLLRKTKKCNVTKTLKEIARKGKAMGFNKNGDIVTSMEIIGQNERGYMRDFW